MVSSKAHPRDLVMRSRRKQDAKELLKQSVLVHWLRRVVLTFRNWNAAALRSASCCVNCYDEVQCDRACHATNARLASAPASPRIYPWAEVCRVISARAVASI